MISFKNFCSEETSSSDVSTTGSSFGITKEYLENLIQQEIQKTGFIPDFEKFIKKHKIPPENKDELFKIFRYFWGSAYC